ncbi:RIP metalloprotease RseP [bacterium]|nr:RIP metalloprotease RseP [bacterium]
MIILIVIISLSVLIFFHEFGHFIASKIFHVKVEEFGFGYPPRMFGFVRVGNKRRFFWGRNIPKGKNIGTIYSLNWIPFGGFNKLKEAKENDEQEKDVLEKKSWWQKSLIAVAGAGMNVVLTILLFFVLFYVGPKQVITPDIADLKIRDTQIVVASVFKNTPAEKAGLRISDIILKIDDKKIENIKDVQEYLKDKANKVVTFKIKRENKIFNLDITPTLSKEIYPNQNSKNAVIGVVLTKMGRISCPFHQALIRAIKQTFKLFKQIIIGLGLFFKAIIVQHKVIGEAVGIVGLASLTGEAAKLGFGYLINFLAIISLLIAITQLIPFPALDGGHLMFYLIEGIRKKPISPRTVNVVNNIGFILLMVLMIFLTYKDILRIILKKNF